jgi:hypothetical protein
MVRSALLATLSGDQCLRLRRVLPLLQVEVPPEAEERGVLMRGYLWGRPFTRIEVAPYGPGVLGVWRLVPRDLVMRPPC